MARRRGLCVCGGSWATHQDPDDEVCWCPSCLRLPESERCRVFDPPRRRPVEEPVAYVGGEHPETAKAMERRSLPKRGSLRRQVLDQITLHHGLSDDEIEVATGRSHQSVSGARNTLMNDGWIRDSGRRRVNRYGNDAVVWVRVAGE